MNRVYISYGSNMGDRYANIDTALNMIKSSGFNIIKNSKLYKTDPYGFTDQPEFVNGAAEIETDMDCRSVLYKLLDIESKMGRVRKFKWGPRVIDLDIIFFNNQIINEKDLVVPHPDMQNRFFVLKPLYEIAPDFIHPVLNISISEMLKSLEGVK